MTPVISADALPPALRTRFGALAADLLSWDGRRAGAAIPDPPVALTAGGMRIAFSWGALHDFAADEAMHVAAALDEAGSVPNGILQRIAREMALAVCRHTVARVQASRLGVPEIYEQGGSATWVAPAPRPGGPIARWDGENLAHAIALLGPDR